MLARALILLIYLCAGFAGSTSTTNLLEHLRCMHPALRRPAALMRGLCVPQSCSCDRPISRSRRSSAAAQQLNAVSPRPPATQRRRCGLRPATETPAARPHSHAAAPQRRHIGSPHPYCATGSRSRRHEAAAGAAGHRRRAGGGRSQRAGRPGQVSAERARGHVQGRAAACARGGRSSHQQARVTTTTTACVTLPTNQPTACMQARRPLVLAEGVHEQRRVHLAQPRALHRQGDWRT